ncbi:DivIVA domain-containing protein [Fulvivirgaceae bacterium BMA10]|uniref:DivIVA domain-containing protein n=1 Tax=Splendidivirga corallicola TaxID=3051826 RepID=A0ABT8KTP4_9BACT|nr:DivIVA domain-containing protein [Fulvivirgaceae bacterium BMA10]
MKITPLDIRQKSFEKVFRGYDKEEVNAFLKSLSQEWEKLLDETKELRLKLEASEKEVEKLRQVETSLFKTLKTAEDTGANLIDQANKAAELHLKESQMKAEGLLSEAQSKARSIIEEAEIESKSIIEDMEGEVKSLKQSYKILEAYYDDLLNNFKNLAQDTLQKVDKINEQRKETGLESHILKAKEVVNQSKERTQTKTNFNTKSKPSESKDSSLNSKEENNQSTSFFDQIE